MQEEADIGQPESIKGTGKRARRNNAERACAELLLGGIIKEARADFEVGSITDRNKRTPDASSSNPPVSSLFSQPPPSLLFPMSYRLEYASSNRAKCKGPYSPL